MLLTYWEHKYCQLQNDSVEAKAESAGPKELLSFNVDMNRLATLMEDVLSENAQEHVKFLSVHCTPLKQVMPCCGSVPPRGCFRNRLQQWACKREAW